MNFSEKEIWTIIVTFNGEGWIVQCISSLKHSTVPCRILVVDNASKDGTVNLITSKFPQCDLISLDKNIGFGRANNLGIEYALAQDAKYLVLLNQDARVAPTTLELLLKEYRSNPKMGVIAPIFHEYDSNVADWYMNTVVLKDNIDFARDFRSGIFKPFYEVKMMPAAMWFFGRELILDTGGFDPLFFMYGEDDDLWRRAMGRGWICGIVPSAVCYHFSTDKSYDYNKNILKEYASAILLIKSDITKSFTSMLLRYLIYGTKDIIKSLFLFDFRKSRILVLVFLKIIRVIGIIRRHRTWSFYRRSAFLKAGTKENLSCLMHHQVKT